jgi:predicted nucleic acid-binding protein
MDLEDLIEVDTNILAYALDPTFPEHSQAKKAILSSNVWAVNVTVVHECYHAIVFRRKISPRDSKLKIVEFIMDERTTFLNLTKRVSLFALNLAAKTNLGGRDSLILGCYLQNNITEIYSHDAELVKLDKISIKRKHTRITDPTK